MGSVYLIIVMLLGMQIAAIALACPSRSPIRVVGVVHTGTKVRVAVRHVRVPKTKSVTDLVTHDKLPPGWRVIRVHGEVVVIHLGRTLADVPV